MSPDTLTFFRSLKGLIPFLVAGYHYKRRNVLKARMWSDRYLRHKAPYFAVGLATDALIMIFEGRNADAKRRFSESLKQVRDIYDENDEDYVRQFAQLYIAILTSIESKVDYDRLGGFEELAKLHDKLAETPASYWIKKQLRLPICEKLNMWTEISSTTQPPPRTDAILLQRLDIRFDF